jgi:hypothetical protein
MSTVYKIGTNGADYIDASTAALKDLVVFYGLGGNDSLIGHAGVDQFDGGKGTDFMFGGGGNDLFFESIDNVAGKLHDTLVGGDGTDEVIFTLSSYQLDRGMRGEFNRLLDFMTHQAGDPAQHFVSNALHVDMSGIESARVRLDGVLHALSDVAAPPPPAVITFEGLANTGTYQIPDGYAGFNWGHRFYTIDTHTFNQYPWVVPFLPNSGYNYGAEAPGHTVAYNGWAVQPLDITKARGDADFVFAGVDVTAAWDQSEDVTFTGYHDGAVVGQTTVHVNDHGPTHVAVSWGAIDDLHITTANGVWDPSHRIGYTWAYGDHVAFDNFLMG